jgi:leucine dehydrogenase
VINAGGIINVSFEKDYDAAKSTAKVEEIYNTLLKIFSQADAQNRTTGAVADEMAKAIIEAAKQ